MRRTNRWIVGTQKRYTYQMDRTLARITALPETAPATRSEPPQLDPALQALVQDIIGRVADKWTMFVLEALVENGRLRFTRLGELIDGISQKMLTKTLRAMEADGLVVRTVFPVVPPRVEYELTEIGTSLSGAFCGVWHWAEDHHEAIKTARAAFRERNFSQ